MKSNSISPKLMFIVFSILFTSLSIAQSKTTVMPKIGVDAVGNHSVSGFGQSGDLDVNTGVSFGFDLLTNVSENFNIGMGVLYQTPREQEAEGSGNFNFVPLYGIVKIKIGSSVQPVIPCLVANVGYSVLFNGEDKYKGPFSLKGGLYFGGGIQIEISNFVIEGMYRSFNGTAELDNSGFQSSGGAFDITYTTLSVMIGVMI